MLRTPAPLIGALGVIMKSSADNLHFEYRPSLVQCAFPCAIFALVSVCLVLDAYNSYLPVHPHGLTGLLSSAASIILWVAALASALLTMVITWIYVKAAARGHIELAPDHANVPRSALSSSLISIPYCEMEALQEKTIGSHHILVILSSVGKSRLAEAYFVPQSSYKIFIQELRRRYDA